MPISHVSRWLRAHAGWLAPAIWTVTLAAMMSYFLRGEWRAIPYGEYVGAGRRWIEHAPLYDLRNIDGFQYFPQSALLFSFFARLGSPLGDVVWRVLGWCGYATGLFSLACRLFPTGRQEAFLIATALAIGSALPNLVNGQANLMLAALVLHVAVSLIERRWWLAAALLAAGVGLKPLMVVPLLLAGGLYRPLAFRLPVALLVVALVPWLFRDHAYVVKQYADCFVKLGLCANPDRQFEDLRGLVSSLGFTMSQPAYFVVRATAALAVFAICVRVRSVIPDPLGTLIVVAYGLAYLMLFNPRTLTTSYAMPGATAALLGARYVLERDLRRAGVVAAVCLAWTINHHVAPFVQFWLRPLACIVFCGVLFEATWRRPAAATPEAPVPVLDENMT